MSLIYFRIVVTIIAIFSFQHIQCQYVLIWSDDMDTNNGWSTYGDVRFPRSSTGCGNWRSANIEGTAQKVFVNLHVVISRKVPMSHSIAQFDYK